ncbi:hypothetical protein [Ktedonobacter robiniae]|nr:hypothetical protein [Ktedonobacter robiniae]
MTAIFTHPGAPENIGAVQVELTEGDLRKIDHAMSTITVLGDRY